MLRERLPTPSPPLLSVPNRRHSYPTAISDAPYQTVEQVCRRRMRRQSTQETLGVSPVDQRGKRPGTGQGLAWSTVFN